jgi:hypothetical protein
MTPIIANIIDTKVKGLIFLFKKSIVKFVRIERRCGCCVIRACARSVIIYRVVETSVPGFQKRQAHRIVR